MDRERERSATDAIRAAGVEIAAAQEVAKRAMRKADKQVRRMRSEVKMDQVMPGGNVVVGSGDSALELQCSTVVRMSLFNDQMTLQAREFGAQLVCWRLRPERTQLGTIYLKVGESLVLTVDSVLRRLDAPIVASFDALRTRPKPLVCPAGITADREAFIRNAAADFRAPEPIEDVARRSTQPFHPQTFQFSVPFSWQTADTPFSSVPPHPPPFAIVRKER